MAKPHPQHQEWLDLNPCAMCGKALNRPYGKERSHGQYITIESRGSCGGAKVHKMRSELNSRHICIGLCCIDKLTKGLSQ